MSRAVRLLELLPAADSSVTATVVLQWETAFAPAGTEAVTAYEATQGIAASGECPYEAAPTLTATTELAWTANKGLATTGEQPYETAFGVAAADDELPWDATEGVSMTDDAPWEAVGQVTITAEEPWDATDGALIVLVEVPYDARGALTQTAELPWDTWIGRLSIARLITLPYEAKSLKLGRRVQLPWETKPPIRGFTRVVWEARGNVKGAARRLPWDAASPLVGRKSTLPWDAETTFRFARATLPYEARRVAIIQRTARMSWEALGGKPQGIVVLPWDSRGIDTIIVTVTLPYEAGGHVMSSVVEEWEAAGSAQVFVALPYEVAPGTISNFVPVTWEATAPDDYVVFIERHNLDWQRLATISDAVGPEAAIATYTGNRITPSRGHYLAIRRRFWPPYDVTVLTSYAGTAEEDLSAEPADTDVDEH